MRHFDESKPDSDQHKKRMIPGRAKGERNGRMKVVIIGAATISNACLYYPLYFR